MAPPALDRLVRRCLAKDPDERWQSAADLASELAWIAEAGSKAGLPTSVGVRRRSRIRLASALAGAIAGAVVTAILFRTLTTTRRGETPPLIRFSIDYPPSMALSSLYSSLAVSPDGRRIATVRQSGESRMLFVRDLNELEDRPISGSEGSISPFFSPDGAWVGFQSQGKIRKALLAGGAPIVLCDAEKNLAGASWGTDGTIVYSPTASSGLYRISSAGGPPQPLTQLDARQGETSHRWPQILPGGRDVLFSISTGMVIDKSRIAVASLATGTARPLIKDATFARYVAPGYLLWTTGNQFLAAPFDAQQVRITGQPVTLLEELWRGDGAFAASTAGTIAYLPEPPGAKDWMMVWVDRTGREMPIGVPSKDYIFPSFSPDGRFLAATASADSNGLQIWLLDLTRGVLSRFTFEGANHFNVWTPDGKRLVFSSTRAGAANLYWQAANGSGPAEPLVRSPQHEDPSSVSPDGKFLAYAEIDPKTNWDIWVLPLTGDHKPFIFRRTPANEVGAMFSPDGRWIAYASDESGRSEIYVQAFPGPGGRVQVSIEGGFDAAWSPAGREIFYRSGKKMMVVAYEANSEFRAGRPSVLFEGPYEGNHGFGAPNYAVSRDGKRFLMIRGSDKPLTRVVVWLNLPAELASRFAAGRR
jgi:Tol biopolymer transport system component